MKNRNTSRLGFTLIELLVVVLIIGILAAVAVPQYQKAVWKARNTQFLSMVNAYKKAIDLYILENGYEDVKFASGNTSYDSTKLVVSFSPEEVAKIFNNYEAATSYDIGCDLQGGDEGNRERCYIIADADPGIYIEKTADTDWKTECYENNLPHNKYRAQSLCEMLSKM